jgi:hypothetical protein
MEGTLAETANARDWQFQLYRLSDRHLMVHTLGAVTGFPDPSSRGRAGYATEME